MLMIGKPNKAWGIAHQSTDITGSLFSAELFTFRHQAEKFILRANKTLGRDNGLHPVLVEISASICECDAAAEYDAEQVEWLRVQRGAA